jgi:hypothetical protein
LKLSNERSIILLLVLLRSNEAILIIEDNAASHWNTLRAKRFLRDEFQELIAKFVIAKFVTGWDVHIVYRQSMSEPWRFMKTVFSVFTAGYPFCSIHSWMRICHRRAACHGFVPYMLLRSRRT